MDIIYRITTLFPNLKKDLRMAHITHRPDIFVKRTLNSSLTFSLGIIVFMFFMFQVFKISMALLLPAFIVLFILFFFLFISSPKVSVSRRKRDLDREVLFAGRFLLVKIHSGTPIINALVGASKSYGIAAKYFKEIVDDISMGTPLENALDNAIKYSPSDKFRKVLFHINNSIKIGMDISTTLKDVLDEITAEQLIDIQRYGKKLNSLAMFYMLLAVVLPSLGMTMLIVVGGLLAIPLGPNMYIAVVFFLIIIQLVFIIIFKSTRLTVNL